MRLTMLRQRRIAKPRAPRTAPTTMKTVPSGRLDCCINGALFVGGTLAAGYVGITPGPVKVGNPVNSSPPVACGPPVMVGFPVGSLVSRAPVLLIETLFEVVEEGVSFDGVSLLLEDEGGVFFAVSLGVSLGVSLAVGVAEGLLSVWLEGVDFWSFWALAGPTIAMAERSRAGPGR
jgi:hypothetical protein